MNVWIVLLLLQLLLLLLELTDSSCVVQLCGVAVACQTRDHEAPSLIPAQYTF